VWKQKEEQMNNGTEDFHALIWTDAKEVCLRLTISAACASVEEQFEALCEAAKKEMGEAAHILSEAWPVDAPELAFYGKQDPIADGERDAWDEYVATI
jgi:hypothetical protein